jgi:hypothetical protein
MCSRHPEEGAGADHQDAPQAPSRYLEGSETRNRYPSTLSHFQRLLRPIWLERAQYGGWDSPRDEE